MFPVESFSGPMKGLFLYASIDSIAEDNILLNLLYVRPWLIRRWKSTVVMLRKSEDVAFCFYYMASRP